MQIIYQDEYLLAVHKPNNMLVHHSAMANNQWDELSLVQILFKELGANYYPIHRLDRKTSGIILFTKKRSMLKFYKICLLLNKFRKPIMG